MIQYTIAKKKVNTKAGEKEMYYPKIVRAATVDTKKIAALLQERTTLDIGEVYGFLTALSKGIRYYVTDSYVVEVEGLGIFSPTMRAKSVDSADALKTDTITKKGVNYRPTADMKKSYKQIKFTKANLKSAHL